MNERFVDLATRAARYSEHPMRMGAVIAQKNRLVSFGCNKRRTHPKSPNAYKAIHAELDAVLNIDPERLEGATVYVVRLTRGGQFATSRPCTDCYKLLASLGIRHMFYVNSDRKVVGEAL